MDIANAEHIPYDAFLGKPYAGAFPKENLGKASEILDPIRTAATSLDEVQKAKYLGYLNSQYTRARQIEQGASPAAVNLPERISGKLSVDNLIKANGALNKLKASNSTGQKISEAGYLNRIELLESIYGSRNVHSLEKHGAQTTGMKQYRRVQHKDYPNPTTGAPGNKTKTASKFLTNKDHYEVLRSAILQRKASPEVNDFDVVLNRNIGVNIKNLGSHKNRGPYSAEYTNAAIVRFDPNTGKMFTAFPIHRGYK